MIDGASDRKTNRAFNLKHCINNIKTTLNLDKNVLNKITEASIYLGISRTKIIVMLLKKVMKKDSYKASIQRGIRYQECNYKENWHIFHITLNNNEYEYFLDLRKLLKMSLSYIVAYAVKKYLKSLFSDKSRDNYMFSNYVLAKENADGIIYWKLFWGMPGKIEKYLSFIDS